mmetsp:Transcript_12655/g.18447  ORF Transcript_12655/g.18447 Transcript_12655/m.18447 type:complete len:117 (-) Transcript_12655:375-725(-)
MEGENALAELETRKSQCFQLLKLHPNKIPIILEPSQLKSSFVLGENKFLVPNSYTLQELVFHLRKRLKMRKTDGLFLVIGDRHLTCLNKTIKAIYEEHRNLDGFLYVKYSTEACWG